ncbi:MAG: SUMF1/EgtB/PvdO family nonheme iron enzyme, partial [Anaerolineales bacterium]|nr:SUMF1/EgtB/PvdO family nonheme iron enzyme [Anaerolineales bacterium]
GLFARDFPKVRLVVTSRPYAYGSGWDLSEFQFKVTTLEPFSDEQIAFFIDQWYTVMGQHDITLGSERAQTFAVSLRRQIEGHRNLQEMAQHPLLLTMMVYIHRGREGGALPQRREELYRLCVVLLLDLWRRSKVTSGRETETLADLLGMDTERLQKALAEVAFVAHRDQPEQQKTADIPGMVLAGILHKHKSKEGRVDMDEIIEYVRDRAGLLEDHGRNADDSDDVYRFPHRTFQEYLAAMHMLEAADFPDQMVKLARQDPDRWREAVLLAMSAARPAMQWAAVEALYGHRPVPEPATICSDEEWWGAFLAGQVLVEAEMLVDVPDYRQTTLQQVRAWHEQLLILGKLTPRDRALAGQVLASLGDPRQGVGVVQRNGTWVPDIAWGEEVPAGAYEVGGDRQAYKGLDRQNIAIERPYRLSRYPITNVQFDSFLEAGDRNNAEWWAGIPEREQSFRDPAFPFANHPRETVSWYQAVVFCRWLTDKFRSALPPGAEITLPHEYEWEVAARWPDGRAYPWGETF